MTQFHMDLDIHDSSLLLQAAVERAIAETPGLQASTAEEQLAPDGQVDVRACLEMLLDPGILPGCSIHQSWVDLGPESKSAEVF